MLKLKGNIASVQGGGIYSTNSFNITIDSTFKCAQIASSSISFFRNKAVEGGGLFLSTMAQQLLVINSNMYSGSAIYFYHNRAKFGHDVCFREKLH